MDTIETIDKQIKREQRARRNKTLTTYAFVIVSAFILAEQYIFFSNFNNIAFALRRQDLVQAAQMVDVQERKQLKVKQEELKNKSLKQMLSPLVVADNK